MLDTELITTTTNHVHSLQKKEERVKKERSWRKRTEVSGEKEVKMRGGERGEEKRKKT